MSNKPKVIIGYRVSEIYRNSSIADVQHISVTIRELRSCCPKEELFHASQYSDDSLACIQDRVRRMKQLFLDRWYETTWSDNNVTIELQGSIERGDWYAASVERCDISEFTGKILSKLLKANESRKIQSLQALLAALVKIGAVPVKHDGEVSFWYVVKDDQRVSTDSPIAVQA